MMGKYLIKELPAGPNEGFAVASLLMTRRFSNHNNGCFIRSVTWGVAGGGVVKWTLLALRIFMFPYYLILPTGGTSCSCRRAVANGGSYGQRLAP
jgi:hypothetical protein